jgi:hypothetical protein
LAFSDFTNWPEIELLTRVAIGHHLSSNVVYEGRAPYTLLLKPNAGRPKLLCKVITGQERQLLAVSLDVGPLAGLPR